MSDIASEQEKRRKRTCILIALITILFVFAVAMRVVKAVDYIISSALIVMGLMACFDFYYGFAVRVGVTHLENTKENEIPRVFLALTGLMLALFGIHWIYVNCMPIYPHVR